MNATERVEAAGITFSVGQTVTLEWMGKPFESDPLEDGDYVILEASTLQPYDVARNRETAETMANEWGDSPMGFIAYAVNGDDGGVCQYWRDIAADCWGWEY